MARRDDGFLSTRRKVAWMFFGLWAVVLVMAAVRYAVHGDMVVKKRLTAPQLEDYCNFATNKGQTGGVFRLVIVEAPIAP